MKVIIPIKGTIRSCQYCKEPFIAQRKDKIYCTHSCKQMAFMKRQPPTLHIKISTVKKVAVVVKKEGFLKCFFKAFW